MNRWLAMSLYWALLLVTRFHPLSGRGRKFPHPFRPA